jgi:hypothetical protein
MNNGASVNIAQCTPAGTGTQGTVCGTAGTQGSDNMCAKGYTCSTITTDNVPRCRRMCQKAASNCGAAMCLSYSPVYTINGVEYGICQ